MDEKIILSKGFTLIEIMYVVAVLSILAAIAIFHLPGYRKGAQDAVTKENLRQAYIAAQVYFVNNPGGSKVNLSSLQSYGFVQSENVGLRMEGNGYEDLLMTAAYVTPGSQTFAVDWKGKISPVQGSPSNGGSGPSSSQGGENGNPGGGEGEAPENGSPQNSAALRDLMKSTLTQAHAASDVFFRTYPKGVVTLSTLNEHGVIPDESLSLIIENGTAEGLIISVSAHVPEMQSYTIDSRGVITP